MLEQSANSSEDSKVFELRYRRVSMAEGSKPDVPLFQLLTDLLQQVRTQLCLRGPDLPIASVLPWPADLGRIAARPH